MNPSIPALPKLTILLLITAISPLVGKSVGQTESGIRWELLETVQRTDLLSAETSDVASVLTTLTADTKFAHHVNVNRPVIESAVNVYILAGDLSTRANLPQALLRSHILGNCAYIGASNAIICDPVFIDSFLAEHGALQELPDSGLPQSMRDYQFAFLAWVLGHELGHVVAGDRGAHFGELDVLDSKHKAAVEMTQKEETAADLFAARQIELDKGLRVNLQRMLISLIDGEVAEKNGKSPSYGVGLHWDYASKRIIQYFANQDHPEFVIRATRMLTFLAEDTHDDALKALIETFAAHLVQVGVSSNRRQLH
jgi:hypothetical protein